MFYAIIIQPNCETPPADELVFEDIKDATQVLKKHKGSRMKAFSTKEEAIEFLNNPEKDESFIEDPSFASLSESLEKLTIGSGGDEFPSVKPGLLNQLRRAIEKGEGEKVEEMIWKNPKFLITVCDSAVYLMAGPKYNACHIAARANQPDIMATILDTISNISFMRLLYPKEPDTNVQDRVDHLLDSYLNTPDPRQGNTPLHFACKLGHYMVVRVLLTFEGCDLSLKDSSGKTAEESICLQTNGDDETIKKKIKRLFKSHLHLPLYRDQLKKKLLLDRRRHKAGADSDTSFSDISFTDDSFTFISPIKTAADSNATTRQSALASPASETTATINKYH